MYYNIVVFISHVCIIFPLGKSKLEHISNEREIHDLHYLYIYLVVLLCKMKPETPNIFGFIQHHALLHSHNC